MNNKLEKEVRFLKAYAVIATLLGSVFVLTPFTRGVTLAAPFESTFGRLAPAPRTLLFFAPLNNAQFAPETSNDAGATRSYKAFAGME